MLLALACTQPGPDSTQELVDTEVPAPPPPSPHRVLLLDVGGRLEWDGSWSLTPGATTALLNTETEALATTEHCRLSNREDPLTSGVSPIRLSTSIERIAGHWNGEAYDMVNFEGRDVFGPDDTLRAYNDELGLDLSVSSPPELDGAAVLGPADGLSTPVLADVELVWTAVFAGDVVLFCAVPHGNVLVPDEGIALLADEEPDFIKLTVGNAVRAEGFFAEPAWLLAGRGYDVNP